MGTSQEVEVNVAVLLSYPVGPPSPASVGLRLGVACWPLQVSLVATTRVMIQATVVLMTSLRSGSSLSMSLLS